MTQPAAPSLDHENDIDTAKETIAPPGADGTANEDVQEQHFDVVIMGGGLAGLTLARQIRQALPQWSVAVIERHVRPIPEAAWKVGESSVEVGSRYLEELGLAQYLLDRQLVKFGLRFFPGGGQLPIHERTEIGPSREPVVKSYQLDRGRFESDLRGMLERDGVTLLEGYKATDVVLAADDGSSVSRDQKHRLRASKIRRDAEAALEAPRALSCRWLVDASGREAVLRRRLDLREDSGHAAHAGWFRVEGKVDINDWVTGTPGETRWMREEWSSERWRSTNHLMGEGYWCWIIPLASGNTSIGVVVHEEHHRFTNVNTLDACLQFLREHEPQMFDAVRHCSVMDFRCLRGYSHGAHDLWSSNRYAVVGEAGAFVDPLYSPGSDFIAFANSFTLELMRRDLRDQPLAPAALAFNERYRQLVERAVELYRTAGPIYGHAGAMAAKVYFDNFGYWSFFAQYYFQKFYAELGPAHDNYVNFGIQLADLSRRLQTLFRAWATATVSDVGPVFVGMPRFPSLLVDVYMDLRERRDIDAATELLQLRVSQAKEVAAELALRVLINAGPELGPKLLACEEPETADLPSLLALWGIDEARIDVEFLPSLVRRKALSAAARDVERTLGRVVRHPKWALALNRSTEPLPEKNAADSSSLETAASN